MSGRRRGSGHPVERAGLTNGSLYGVTISVEGRGAVTEEDNAFGLGNATTGYIGKGRFGMANLGDVSNLSAVQLENASIAAGVARLQRCEDGAWDPRRGHENDFYFVTTASEANNCRLWRLRFDDIENPEQGGTIEIVLRGDEGHKMLDNVTIDGLGRILMDEDPGNTHAHRQDLAVLDRHPRSSSRWPNHNPKFFDGSTATNPSFITQDEETSGIIDAEHILGEGWFLLDVQAHKANPDAELVEFGQLLALWVHPDVGMLKRDDDHGNRHDDNHERR